ncbi:hypothetical protein NP233_g6083 [Leucocoprinus birnbaumii]|uniref:Protein kinase domain-containing protein n=1 Tax=Leucocoprinus birnbaumii TaxID=56174 RepID=A0AAD5YW39_9AGAR|nr:hypothetical protein NP233_g6083 [Leucocoprinus birnbaumii]
MVADEFPAAVPDSGTEITVSTAGGLSDTVDLRDHSIKGHPLPSTIPNTFEASEPCTRSYNLASWYIVTDRNAAKYRVRTLRLPGLGAGRPSHCLSPIQDRVLSEVLDRVPTHPFIAPMGFCTLAGRTDTATGRETVALVSPFYELSVLDRLNDARQDERLKWARQTCQAVESLHQRDIVHGNIHLGNFMIDRDNNAVLVDTFLFTATVQSLGPSLVDELKNSEHMYPDTLAYKRRSVLGDPNEELILALTKNPTKRDDVFSLAVTIWTIFEGKRLWQECQKRQIIRKIMEGNHKSMDKPLAMDAELWSVIKKPLHNESDEASFDPAAILQEIITRL